MTARNPSGTGASGGPDDFGGFGDPGAFGGPGNPGAGGGSGAPGEERLPPPAPPLSAQSWREVVHLLCNMPVGVIGFVYIAACISASAGLSFTLVGLPLLALTLLGARGLGRFERARARMLLRVRIDEPSPVRAREDGFLSWLWAQLKDSVAWRHVLYFFVRLPWGWLSFGVTLPALFVAWPVLPWLARGLTNVDRALVRGLLSPSDELERRIAELESDRGSVADTAAADLRRIERDLHDGAQARLVTLAMDLGLAKEKLLEDPQAAADMVDEAHGEAKLALQELRDLARGIHPAILTDRGLAPALTALATRCTATTTITDDLPQRPAQAIEGITYFTASELLQNITKHANATTAHIDLWKTHDHLHLQITDNGKGGANTTHGTGLKGLTERLTAVDGLLLIDSPTGGPTTITAQLPWRV
jgi:signal transduction histidine kinase